MTPPPIFIVLAIFLANDPSLFDIPFFLVSDLGTTQRRHDPPHQVQDPHHALNLDLHLRKLPTFTCQIQASVWTGLGVCVEKLLPILPQSLREFIMERMELGDCMCERCVYYDHISRNTDIGRTNREGKHRNRNDGEENCALQTNIGIEIWVLKTQSSGEVCWHCRPVVWICGGHNFCRARTCLLVQYDCLRAMFPTTSFLETGVTDERDGSSTDDPHRYLGYV